MSRVDIHFLVPTIEPIYPVILDIPVQLVRAIVDWNVRYGTAFSIWRIVDPSDPRHFVELATHEPPASRIKWKALTRSFAAQGDKRIYLTRPHTSPAKLPDLIEVHGEEDEKNIDENGEISELDL